MSETVQTPTTTPTAGTITIYTSCKIGDEKPIEGSVSISSDNGSITKLKFEGGGVAAYKVTKHPDVTMSWKTPGATDTAVSTQNVTKTLVTDDNASLAITGVYTKSPGWDQQWGHITEHTIVGKVGSDDDD